MKKRSFLWTFIFSLLGFILASCTASVPLAPKDMDQQAKQFEEPSDQASIYVTRRSSSGFGIPYNVFINGRMIGSLAQDTYYHFKLDPGKYVLALSSSEGNDRKKINAKESEIYFYDAVVKSRGRVQRPKLVQLNSKEGMKAVKDSKLIKKDY